MAVVDSYDWESGQPTGTAMTPANSGLNLATGWTYSNAQLLAAGGGALSGRTTATAGTTFLNGLSAFTAEAAVWTRFYLYVATLPAATTSILQLRSGSTMRCELRVSSTGGFQIRNSASTQVLAPVASTITAGAWVRVEWRYSNTAGQTQLRVFTGANLHGATPDYDSGNVTTTAAGTVDGWQFGILNSATMTMHVDSFVVDDATWVGSAVNVAPTADAGADQVDKAEGALVTLSGSDSDSDGTVVTRTWTQLSGTAVTLSGASTATATFTVPTVAVDETLTFQYEVEDDDGATDTDTCTVGILAPVETDDGGIRIYLVSSGGTKQECAAYLVHTDGSKLELADIGS